MNKIEKVIKKAECIREYLEEYNNEKGNIDQLIESLKSYQAKYGDLPAQKYFYIIVDEDVRVNEMAKNLPVYFEQIDFQYCTKAKAIVVKSSEFTVHIKDIIVQYVKRYTSRVWSMPPAVIDYDIADAVWDIESTKIVDVELTNKFIAAGLKPTSNSIKFAGDFD